MGEELLCAAEKLREGGLGNMLGVLDVSRQWVWNCSGRYKEGLESVMWHEQNARVSR